jgi:hypothetical protein
MKCATFHDLENSRAAQSAAWEMCACDAPVEPAGGRKNNFHRGMAPRAEHYAQRGAGCEEGTFPLRTQPTGVRNALLLRPCRGGSCFSRALWALGCRLAGNWAHRAWLSPSRRG